MASVILTNITKRFGNTAAVDDVSLEIPDGSFTVLVGPSGCGKTTILRMIAGLEDIESGQVRIGSTVVNDIPPAGRDIAMVFQSYALYPHMTVAQNIGFGLRLRKMPKMEIQARIAEVSKMLGLQDLLLRKPRQLSGGQRQRVALGRAIARRPAVFLMDEPLSNLDAKLRAQTRAELIRLYREIGTTVIYVTHDQIEAMTMGQQVVVMNEGRVQQVASPHEVYLHPANSFVAGFIGYPPMNLVPISFNVDHQGPIFCLGEGGETIPVFESMDAVFSKLNGKRVILGIRPEHIHLANGTSNHGLMCRVEMTELMGHDTLVHLETNGLSLLARFDSRWSPQHGDLLRISFDENYLNFFDADTAVNIDHKHALFTD